MSVASTISITRALSSLIFQHVIELQRSFAVNNGAVAGDRGGTGNLPQPQIVGCRKNFFPKYKFGAINRYFREI